MPAVTMPTGEVVDMPDNPTPAQLAELELIHSPSGLTTSAKATPAAPAVPMNADEALGGILQTGLPIAKHYGGLTARALATGATGTAGMLADLPVQATNWVTKHFGKQPYELPSEQFQGFLGRTLGEPQNMTERVLLGLGSLAAGTKDPLANAIRAHFAQPLSPTPEFNKTIEAAQQLGLKATPEQVGGSTLSRAAQGFVGGEHMTAQAAYKNRAAIDNVLRDELGVPKTFGLTRENLESKITETYDLGYEPLKQFGPVQVGGIYRQALTKVKEDFAGVSANDPKGINPQVTTLVDQNLNRRWTAKEMVDRIALLRKNASDAFDNDNTALAQANRSIARALEDALEMNIKASPRPEDMRKLVDYREARTQLAKLNAVYDAVISGSGSGNAAALAKQLKQGVPLTGGLKTIAELASTRPALTAFPKRTPSMFTGLEKSALGAGAGIAMTGNLPMAAKFLAYPALSVPTRAAMLTQPFQSAFVNPQAAPMNFQQALTANKNLINALPTGFQLGGGLFGQ